MPQIAFVHAPALSERLPPGLRYPLRGGALTTCMAPALAHEEPSLPPSHAGALASLIVRTATWCYTAGCLLHPDTDTQQHPLANPA